MQPFEKPRYEQAVKTFSEAFDRAYAAAKRDLQAGKAELADIDSVFHVEVSRNDVLDNEWAKYSMLFEEAGRRAALARRRTGEAKLDAADAHPDGRHAAHSGNLRWTVILNASP